MERQQGVDPSPSLIFGVSLRVQRRGGGERLLSPLCRIPRGVYARNEAGEIERVTAAEVDWSGCRRAELDTEALNSGDDLEVESAAGTLRGTLESLGAGVLTLKLAHGASLPIPLQTVTRATLLLVKAEFEVGDAFRIKSKSGNTYQGLVREVFSTEQLTVKLDNGQEANLVYERLRLDSGMVRIPISAAGLRGEGGPLLDTSSLGGSAQPGRSRTTGTVQVPRTVFAPPTVPPRDRA